jgi:oxygen-independent coproporphyrinogen-3 oxidase
MPSLYVHVPFCERKCPYCDFYSVEGGTLQDRYLEALRVEANLLAGRYRAWEFGTLYIGGGTPSLLPAPAFEEMMENLRRSFRLLPECELTVEVNPGTVTDEKLRLYHALGVNRLSIGIQSFSENDLQFLGRIHSAREASECFEAARRAGFANISVDLIYSLPGQAVKEWEWTLRRAIALGPEHISAYSLIVEPGTPFFLMVQQGRWSPNADEREAGLYERTMEILEAEGFEHYEVSNYSRPGFRSRHNSSYWTHENYLGLGPSAHSFESGAGKESTGERWWNIAALGPYLECLEGGRLPVGSREHLDTTAMINERILLGLRSDGVTLEALRGPDRRGLQGDRGALVHDLLAQGLAEIAAGTLKLTPQGFVVCDEIARRLMVG